MENRTKKAIRRNSRGILVMIAALLIASAIVRIGPDAGAAIAREAVQDTAPMPADTPAQDPEGIPHLSPLLKALKIREDRIVRQERRIEDRMRALAMAETSVDEKIQSLIEAENRLRETITLTDGASEKDVSRLTSVYESMKPKDAAALFETMDPEFSAGFLGRMKPEAAANIMSGLSSDVAYSISVILAGRNANAPRRSLENQ